MDKKKLINKKKTWLQWSGLSETDSSLPKNESVEDIMEFFSRFGFVFYGFFFSSFYISQHETKKKVRNWLCEVSSGAQFSF